MLIKIFPKRLIYFIVLFTLGLQIAYCEQNYATNISSVTDERGLQPSATFAIVKDHIGFIWFGTIDGLYRFDGFSFKIFRNKKNNPNSLSNNTVRSLCLGKGGKLWIGTEGGGLNCFDIQSETFINYSINADSINQTEGNSIWSVMEDRDGNIWSGISNVGINKLDVKTQQITHYKFFNDSLSRVFEVRSLLQDTDGTIWIGNGSFGLFRLNPTTGVMENFCNNPNNSNSISSNAVFDVLQDKSGQIWAATYGEGVNLFNRKTKSFTRIVATKDTENSLVSNLTYHIEEIPTSGFWISTEYGLTFMSSDQSQFTTYEHQNCDANSMTDNRIRTTYLDNQGILWIGTQIGVEKLIQLKRFKLYQNIPTKPNSLERGIVRSLLADNEGDLWIGLIDKGLAHYSNKTGVFKSYKHDSKNPKSLAGNNITALFQDSNNDIWIGDWDNGLLKYNKNIDGFETVASLHSLKNKLTDNRIQSIREGKQGVLWLGTEGGINMLNLQTGVASKLELPRNGSNSFSFNGIQSNAFVVDSVGDLWVGMWGGGLSKITFVDGNIKNPTVQHWQSDIYNTQSLNNHNIISLCLAKTGILWIGTYGGGLSQFDIKTNTFTPYTTEDGLPNTIIFSILEDEKGNLWLSTDKGLSMFNPNTKTFQNFDQSDGLQDNHFFLGIIF